MKQFIYIAKGYSHGGYGNYSKITVAEGEKCCKTWRNKKMRVLKRTGKLYTGTTARCEFEIVLNQVREEYPNAQVV
jgi:hypothetical protein